MELTIEGQTINAQVEDTEQIQSPHTGKRLSRIHVSLVSVDEADKSALLELLDRARQSGLRSVDDQGAEKAWKVEMHSYSYVEGGAETEFHHSATLIEQEELMPETLQVSDLSLRPHKYEEDFREDVLSIEAWVELTEEMSRELRALADTGEYHQVVRKGIDERPREMRFGQVVWSRRDTNTKFRLVLVDRLWDEQGHDLRGFDEPGVRNVQRLLAHHIGLVEELLAALTARRVLTPEEVEAMQARAEQQRADRRWAFREVDDADEW